MKKMNRVYVFIALVLMSFGLSSCYIGLYSPGIRYNNGPRFRNSQNRHYHAPVYRHHHHNRGGNGRGRI